MAVSSLADFLTLLEKSRLLGAEQLATAHRLAEGAGDAATLAKALVQEKLISGWQSAQLLAGRATLIFGKYKLIRLLGRGGMGRVFLAEHVTMNRRVALKIVPRHVQNDRAALERFFAEARAIAALDHPNIVQAYSVDNECDRYFIVMEYVDGQDLQQMVEVEGPLGFERAADYIRQAADGLAHAHAHNLVHCDIKPSNLLVNPQGVVKILDMGLVRLGSREEGAHASGYPAGGRPGRPEEQALGSVDYLAPEQAMGTPDFNHRADVYALGCTFYFLLTGHPPFPEGTLAQRIVKHQTQQPRDIRLERPDAPAELVAICRRMMAKRPEDRYQSAAEASRALLAWRPEAHAVAVGNPLKLSRRSDEDISAEEVASGAWLEHMTVSSVVDRPKRPGSTRSVVADGEARPKAYRRVLAAAAAPFVGCVGWFNTPRRKLLGAAAAALLVLVTTLTATIAILWSRSRSSAGPAPVQARSADSHAKRTVQGPDEGPEPIRSKQKTGEERTPAASGSPAESPKEPPRPEPKIQPKAEAKPEPKPEPKPETKPEPKPEPKPEQKPEPKPALKETPPEKPPPAKPTTSLNGLATAVDLPSLAGKDSEDALQPLSLGKIEADFQAVLDVKLLGGDTAAKGRLRFTLQPPVKEEPPGWYVVTGAGEEANRIARLWRDGAEMKFQWLAEAADRNCNYLRNCGLLVGCEGQSHLTALSPPVKTEPLVFDLALGGADARLPPREYLPDPSQLRLKVLVPDKDFPSHVVKVQEARGHEPRAKGPKAKGGVAEVPAGGDTVAARGTVDVILTKQNAPPSALQIHFDPKPSTVSVRMTWEVAVAGKPKEFNERWLRAIEATAAAMDPSFKPKTTKKSPPAGDPSKEIKEFKDRVAALGALAGELNHARIGFKVFVPLTKPGENPQYDLVLFETAGQPQAGAKPGEKPAR
jgi:serine/threonine protein kinase